MQSTRQLKFARVVQKELAEILQRDAKSMFPGNIPSVTRVEVSPDLSVAKVYISFLIDRDKESAFARLNEHKRELRLYLGRSIGKRVRVVPELVFYHDQSAEHADEINRLLKGLHIPPPDAE